ncbi:hypothetical protein [Sphingobium ummariense]|uniref:Uncharacterized protein n=1 Tax=Sphingobium ummariense RL-3 TaxID=1346791 RepID=T0J2S5_9SPHN|nr:hypothetical protein [Sphingobium ummariense]EQB32261.1 hypothetical protein M529_10690 [Sphingobium ummariense RL-3]
MVAFVPDGYLDCRSAIRLVIEARFADEAAEIEKVRRHYAEAGRIPPNLNYRERELARKAEPILRSMLHKGSIVAIGFDEEGEIEVPRHIWATENADGVLLAGAPRMFFSEIRLRSALLPASATILAHPTATRGPRPAKLESVKAAMRAHGDMADLANMKQTVMEETFKASRDTCRRAREQVLSEFRETNPDK